MVPCCSHEGNGQWNVLLPGPILYGGPRGAQIRGPKMGLFSWRHTWIILFAMKSVYIGDHENTIASNFILYRGPDSRPKGPHQMGLFSWRHTWIILFAIESVYIGNHKNTNASNFILYIGPDSSPKGPRGAHNWFIQLKTYMDNSFCSEICIHRGSRKYHCQQLYLVQGPRQ